MNTLKNKIDNAKQGMLKRRKRRYDYAKSKGFNCYECSVLAGRSEKHINELAEKRANGTSQKTNN